MKTLVLILAALVSRAQAQYNVCANRPDGELVNDFSSCNKYFECMQKLPQVRNCPPGWMFSQVLQGCTRCYSCPPQGVVSLPVPQSCTEYVLCVNGEATYRECPPNTMWNEREQNCDLREQTTCQETATPKPTPEPPTDPPPTEPPTDPPVTEPETNDPVPTPSTPAPLDSEYDVPVWQGYCQGCHS